MRSPRLGDRNTYHSVTEYAFEGLAASRAETRSIGNRSAAATGRNTSHRPVVVLDLREPEAARPLVSRRCIRLSDRVQ